MSSIAYYEQLISESYAKIRKYERQKIGLQDFLRENQKGADEFTTKINQRRRNISSSLSLNLRHPMVNRLNTRLSTAISNTYENNVLNNFQAVEDDIRRAVRKLEEQIEDEKNNIDYYSQRIREIEEEERRAAEARRAEEERRAEEVRKAETYKDLKRK
jgi:predicted ribosome quality control (RQC) complex YloA/Tae2 family protein